MTFVMFAIIYLNKIRVKEKANRATVAPVLAESTDQLRSFYLIHAL